MFVLKSPVALWQVTVLEKLATVPVEFCFILEINMY
jgi:hypothetical protein